MFPVTTIRAAQLFNMEVTWHCDVCRRLRPDARISVEKREIPHGSVNIKYCNDDPACVRRAPGKADEAAARMKAL